MKNDLLAIECEEFARKIDELMIKQDYTRLSTYLGEVETFAMAHDSAEYAPVYYYLGTGMAALADHMREEGKSFASRSVIKYREKSLSYIRKALSLLGESCENKELLLSIYTNYANQLDACGRVIEALRIYRIALSINSQFAMLVANYGMALNFYARIVNDPGHSNELNCYAYQALKRALSLNDPNMYEEAKASLSKMVEKYESPSAESFITQHITFKKYDLGKSEERQYRIWCLKHHLFLNPLNDVIEQESAFAHDPLTIAHYTEDITKTERQGVNPPKWFSMLNQLKEEYVYSRYLCFKSVEKGRKTHYADKNVQLSLGSYDYVNYSVRLEQLKASYRILFSIFDQISFFINEFWNIGLQEKDASASQVFVSKKFPKNNIALSAIQWSYFEFATDGKYESDLKVLRNALEHKFVKILDFSDNRKLQLEDDGFYHISETKLDKQVIRLLEIAREWIIELVYAVDLEERQKDTSGTVVQLNVINFEDDWKL